MPCLMFLSGLAPGGVYHARSVASSAVRSYRTFSPLPCIAGGLFSVALSLELPPPDVIRHPDPVEPGLSSPCAKSTSSSHPVIRHRRLYARRSVAVKQRRYEVCLDAGHHRMRGTIGCWLGFFSARHSLSFFRGDKPGFLFLGFFCL